LFVLFACLLNFCMDCAYLCTVLALEGITSRSASINSDSSSSLSLSLFLSLSLAVFKITLFRWFSDRSALSPAVPNRRYLRSFPENELPALLQDIPLREREELIFQYDGIPAHFSRQVCEILNACYPSKWIEVTQSIGQHDRQILTCSIISFGIMSKL